MPYSIRIEESKMGFSASHFLVEHDKCSRIHGHNYRISVEISQKSGELNGNFMVMDFFIIKECLRDIIVGLDHALLLPAKSKSMIISDENGQITVDMMGKHYEFPKEDVRLLPLEATTAELFAKYIHGSISEKFPDYNLIVEVAESMGAIAIYKE